MKKPEARAVEAPVLSFRSPEDWKTWLQKNHAKSTGVWLKIAKKDAQLRSVTYDEALECALCYGWIDGQKKGYDAGAWLQKFSPRGARSAWSKINRQKALALIESGRMEPAGLEAVARAQANGQWEAAYDGQKGIQVPEDLRRELEARPAAKKFYEELNSANRYAILYRLQTAKRAETRATLLKQFVEMLERGEKLHP